MKSCDKNKKQIKIIEKIMTNIIIRFNFINSSQSPVDTFDPSLIKRGFLINVFKKEPITTPTEERTLNSVIGVIFFVLAKYFFIITPESKFDIIP